MPGPLLFFLEKLLDKGGGQRSLHDLSCQFGTRGFSRGMRQIAGGSQSGLRRFLLRYPSLFTLDEDMVSITQASSTVSDSNDSGRDYAQEAVQYFSTRLEQYGVGTQVPIRSLLGHRSQAPPEVRHVSGQHVQEFRDFLAKHPDHFVLRDDVIFLKKHEGQVAETPAADSLVDTPKIDPQVTSKLLSIIRAHLEATSGNILVADLFDQVMPLLLESGGNLPLRKHQDLQTFLKMHSHLFHVEAGFVSLVPLSDYHSQTAKPHMPTCPKPPAQSLKQRINSVVMKVLADNRSQEASDVDDTSTKMDILQRTKVLQSPTEASALLSEFISRGDPVAVDFEGVGVGTGGQITSVQFSTMGGQVFILDVVAKPEIMLDEKLKKLLESPHITKVFHDCRSKSGLLYSQHGIVMKNVFDTQAAHAVLEMQDTGKPVYKVKSETLNTLCERYGAFTNPVKDQVKAAFRRDQKYWARRPLTSDMIIYAAADVLCLLPEVYTSLQSAIKPEFCNLFKELCDEQVMLYIDQEAVKAKKKQRKLNFEISDLRLKMGMGEDNIVLSNREIRLLRHIELTDEDKGRLRGSNKVAKKLQKLESRQNMDSDEDEDNDDDELPSLESVASDVSETTTGSVASPHVINTEDMSSSEPSSLTDSMTVVNKILADRSLNRLERIEKIEAVLTDATLAALGENHTSQQLNGNSAMVDAATQTISTGDISITKVYNPR